MALQPTWSDVPDVLQQKTGITLTATDYTDRLLIAASLRPPGGYWCAMFGPYKDTEDDEPNIFAVWSIVGDHSSLQLLVQDCEGDFLNHNAIGAEKYDVGVVNL